jgi:hypothetical protein
MFEPHLDLSDVPAHDADRDSKILSRCLAAFAIFRESGCSEKEAGAAVWDGGGDNGIDAACYDAADSRVIFVQSKWIEKGSGEPAANDIGSFTKGVKDAVEQDASEFHARLQAKFSDIALRLINPGTRVHLLVISTGASSLAAPGQSRIDQLLTELNGADPDPIASAAVLGLNEVYSGLATDPQKANVTLEANILEWSFINAPYHAYVGMIDGLQLKTWWITHGKRVVAANIRHSLGATEVNTEIQNTAANAPEKFWFFNNGITLVADEAIKAPAGAASRASGIFSFRGASIVNGAQTVSSLAKVPNDAALGIIRVSIRVILLKSAPAGFGADVTRTNNLQNRIELRDFVAQDPEQTRLRQEMAIESVDYQIVRSDDSNSGPASCELVEVTTALACASGDSNLAVQLKTGIGRFYADLTKAPYKAIFNPQLSGAKAFNAVVEQRHIDKWIDAKKGALAKRSGVEWGVLVHGNRLLSCATFKKAGLNLTVPISGFPPSLAAANVDAACTSVFDKMVAAIQANYPGAMLAVLFKNPTKSKHVFDLATV